MNFNRILLLSLALCLNTPAFSQTNTWNGKKCAVVLTYDDALNIHLDKVIPDLNARKLKGTFYLIASSPNVANRIWEWRKAAKKGHELGNHSLNHPCDGSLPGRDWVNTEADLSKYSVARAVHEIRIANTLLKAIDGKERRTFAYPCGDLKIGDSLYYNSLEKDFVAARGGVPGYMKTTEVNFSNVNAFNQSQTTGEQMIEQVKQAEKTGTLIVFLFHGVGGEHNLNVDLAEHTKLLDYLKKNKKNIWVAPMVEIAEYLKRKG